MPNGSVHSRIVKPGRAWFKLLAHAISKRLGTNIHREDWESQRRGLYKAVKSCMPYPTRRYRCAISGKLMKQLIEQSKDTFCEGLAAIPNVVGWMTWGISSALFSSHLSRPLKRSKQTLYLDGKGGQGINTATQDTLRKLQQPMVASGEDFVVGRTVGCQT